MSSQCFLSNVQWNIDGLVQERRYSIALAMEWRLSCTNPSIWRCRYTKHCYVRKYHNCIYELKCICLRWVMIYLISGSFRRPIIEVSFFNVSVVCFDDESTVLTYHCTKQRMAYTFFSCHCMVYILQNTNLNHHVPLEDDMCSVYWVPSAINLLLPHPYTVWGVLLY